MIFYRRLREIIPANPILRLKLAQSSAYTWINLLHASLMSASILLTLFRFVRWRHARDLAAALPPQFQTDEFQRLMEPASHGAMNDIQAELLVAIWLSPLLYLLFDFLDLLLRRSRITDDIRALPVSPRQIVFALYDWPYIKCVLIMLFVIPFQLLPGTRENSEILRGFQSKAGLALLALTVWALIFALHRTLICGPYLKDFRHRLWFDIGWGAWVCALLLVLLCGLLVTDQWRWWMSALFWVGDFALLAATLRIPPDMMSADAPEPIQKWFELWPRRRTEKEGTNPIGFE